VPPVRGTRRYSATRLHVAQPNMFATAAKATPVAVFRPRVTGRARAPRRAAVVTRAEGSYYKVVDGVKLDRKVIEDCEAFQKNDGAIDMEEAERIFQDIVDGPKRRVGGANDSETTVTQCELDTAQYCFDNFNWNEDAKKWFFEKLTEQNW
jgi:hypothetical protein